MKSGLNIVIFLLIVAVIVLIIYVGVPEFDIPEFNINLGIDGIGRGLSDVFEGIVHAIKF